MGRMGVFPPFSGLFNWRGERGCIHMSLEASRETAPSHPASAYANGFSAKSEGHCVFCGSRMHAWLASPPALVIRFQKLINGSVAF